MIFYLARRQHGYTVERYLRGLGRALRSRITILPYEDLPGVRRLQAGTYVFTDIERLAPKEAEDAMTVRRTILDAGIARVLNHPTRSMKRYELLRTLAARGCNSFGAYRLTEARAPKRFPVFIRDENEHEGSITDLLHDQAALDGAIDDICRSGASRDEKLVVEFCDTSDARGIYRKYTACRIGDSIVPTHILFGPEWMLKHVSPQHEARLTDEERREELREQEHYVFDNPHEEQLKDVFDRAHIDYGRIDYAFLDGRMQVWEINSNPNLLGHSSQRAGRAEIARHTAAVLHAAFEAIDDHAGTESVVNPLDPGVVRDTFAAGLKGAVRGTTRVLGVARYERAIERKLAPLARRFE